MSSVRIADGYLIPPTLCPLREILQTKTLEDFLIEDKAIAKEQEKSARWFHGNISRERATRVLQENGNWEGLFLVRESTSSPGDFVVSIIHDSKAKHFHIFNHGDFHYQVGIICVLEQIGLV